MDNTVLNLNIDSDRLFFGSTGHGISRYDKPRYPVLQKLNKNMRSLFWEPEKTDMAGEKRSFNSMTDAEQFVFTENLKRQILLDSIQGRAPSIVFMPYCTDPMLENCLATWGFFETIHSESYTHILKSIYPDPSVVVDSIPAIQPIADCAASIARAYDNMQNNPSKENLYLALIAANALEGIRFYVSFACTFNFGERAMVTGSADVVRSIARDETQHLALTQHILKLLPQDDVEFIEIIADNHDRALGIYTEAKEQEKKWANYLFSQGPILGLTEGILHSYVDHLFQKQASAVGLRVGPKVQNPIPSISKWLSSESLQVAPQELEIPYYLSASSLSNDLDSFVPDF